LFSATGSLPVVGATGPASEGEQSPIPLLFVFRHQQLAGGGATGIE
jgi:hypothetical protein